MLLNVNIAYDGVCSTSWIRRIVPHSMGVQWGIRRDDTFFIPAGRVGAWYETFECPSNALRLYFIKQLLALSRD